MKGMEKRLAKVRTFAAEQGIPVHNVQLLNRALTHTSYANEHRDEHVHDNERLEFLGDAVLDLVIGEYLFLKYPEWTEGELTRAKASVVCESALAPRSEYFHVGEYLLLGRGEEQTGGRTRASILADAFEAIIGAIYIDTSYDEAAAFILTHLQVYLDKIASGNYTHDYKTDLQELVQQQGEAEIRYQLERDEGPDHDKTFYMGVYINGRRCGTGMGKSKKEAAQQAAREALATMTENAR